MELTTVLAVVAASTSVALGGLLLWQDRYRWSSRAFAAGMVVLAARELSVALSTNAGDVAGSLAWQRVSLVAAALLPGLWLTFSLTFSRANDLDFLKKWRWVIVSSFVLPLALVSIGWDALILRPLWESGRWSFN